MMNTPDNQTSGGEKKTKVVINHHGGYFCGDGWISDIRRAHLHTETGARKVIRRLQTSDKRVGVVITYTLADYQGILRTLAQSKGVLTPRHKSKARLRYATRDAGQSAARNSTEVSPK